MWILRRESYVLIVLLSGLSSGCGGVQRIENRSIALPVQEPITSTDVVLSTSVGFSKYGTAFGSDAFQFTDTKPRVLVIGHVNVLQDGSPVDDSGALVFDADGFDSNLASLRFMDRTGEAVSFESGHWFAGHIYAGERHLSFVYFAGDTRLRFRGCGSNIFRFPEWEIPLDLDESPKAYYLGHITYDIVSFETWPGPGGILKSTVRDLSEQHQDELRDLVGKRELAISLMPSCTD